MMNTYDNLLDKITKKSLNVGIIGLGYVGLPLAMAFCKGGIAITGFDIDSLKISSISAGTSYISSINSDVMKSYVDSKRLIATSDFSQLRAMDAIIICVPTPLSAQREPDLSFVLSSIEAVTKHSIKGKIIVLESTTYPGTVADYIRPLLSASPYKENEDYYLAFSPEREDPGNTTYNTHNIPKIVGADHPEALNISTKLYEIALEKVVGVSSTKAAEAAKITENIFRAVNIALVNELKVIYDAMGIDIWEVINAAATKPFGYMPFYPGPGLGGHCIPIDPFYLSWKAREFEHNTRFIELAGEINHSMPNYVVSKTVEALSTHMQKAAKGARILILGIAYKKGVNDLRESPALVIIKRLASLGADISYYDPYAPIITKQREHPELVDMTSIAWDGHEFTQYDAAILVTDHDNVDYARIAKDIPIIIDTRNRMHSITAGKAVIVKA